VFQPSRDLPWNFTNTPGLTKAYNFNKNKKLPASAVNTWLCQPEHPSMFKEINMNTLFFIVILFYFFR
jgi:CCR4-NOT transcriptional regulation complex NOT5 subunit